MNMRRFVKGVDEPIWVEVLNAARKDRDDWRAITAEELILQEQGNPSFDSEGRFIAELEGRPVGVVHANVDKFREESRGFIRLDVLREFRGSGIQQQLLETALTELKARGMTVAQAQADSRELNYIELLERSGFADIRVVSMMEMDLANVPQNIRENKEVAISFLQKDREDDIRLLTWLGNETFKEQFNFRSDTVEEVRHYLRSDLYFKQKEVFFAVIGDERVGYIGVGIDEKYNLEKHVKAGVIFTIGVLQDYRRRGIGAKLMLHGLETLKADGMTKALLGVDDYNPTKAIKLYEKVGFSVKKKDFVFEREL